MSDSLLASLASARWHVAGKTYGNDHSTLIGLVVDWWVSGSPETRWALESGPTCGGTGAGQRGGQCDALLCEDHVAVGVVEVEGTRYSYTLDKLGHFFGSDLDDLWQLRFGIFLGYPVSATGRGEQRAVAPLPLDEWVSAARSITSAHPDRELVVLALDKSWEPVRTGPRARNDYYQCKPATFSGVLVAGGEVVETLELATWE